MNNPIIPRISLFLSVLIFGITSTFHLDPRNLYFAYFFAALSSILHWPVPELLERQNVRYIGEMPKTKGCSIYEINFSAPDRIAKRFITQNMHNGRWTAYGIIDGLLVEEFADDKHRAIKKLINRMKKI